jgi:hypothetical protein
MDKEKPSLFLSICAYSDLHVENNMKVVIRVSVDFKVPKD